MVHDVVLVHGKREEVTKDFYAQDRHGNVWYFGENTKELDRHGHVTSREGSFKAGRKGARPGLFFPANPRHGVGARQFFKGHAEDRFKVRSRHAKVSVPFVSTNRAVRTAERTRLEPHVARQQVLRARRRDRARGHRQGPHRAPRAGFLPPRLTAAAFTQRSSRSAITGFPSDSSGRSRSMTHRPSTPSGPRLPSMPWPWQWSWASSGRRCRDVDHEVGVSAGRRPGPSDPADFSANIDNHRWPMTFGGHWVYRVVDSPIGSLQHDMIKVTERDEDDRRRHRGPGRSRRRHRGRQAGRGDPRWYAQARGNVSYFGEHTIGYVARQAESTTAPGGRGRRGAARASPACASRGRHVLPRGVLQGRWPRMHGSSVSTAGADPTGRYATC